MADNTWDGYASVERFFANSDNSATFMSASTSSSSTISEMDGFALTLGDAADCNLGLLSLDDCSMETLSSPGNTSIMDYLEEGYSSLQLADVTTPEAIQGDALDGTILPLHCDISVVEEEVNQVPVTMMAISPKTPSPLFFQLNQIGISNTITSGGEYQVICPFNMGAGFQNTDQSVPNEDVKPDINAINVKVEAPDASYPSFDIVASHHNYCAFKPTFTAGPTKQLTVPIKEEPSFVPSFQNERRRKQVLSSSSSEKIKTLTKPKAEATTSTTTMRKARKRLYEYTPSDIENSNTKDKGKLRSRVARAVNTKRFHDKGKFQILTLNAFFQAIFKKPRQKKNALSFLRGAPHIMNELSTHCPELFEYLFK